jgi:hypothetical protein
MTAPLSDKVFFPTHPVRMSGVYRAFHDRDHAPVDQVICIRGEVFPRCNRCGGKAKFMLHTAVRHVKEVTHFQVAA